MISRILKIIVRFVVLILIQVLVLNNVVLHGYITPYIYPLFIMLLPINNPRWLTLLLAFAMGLAIDTFSNTGGIHGLALVFLAFVRPAILRVLTPKEGYDEEEKPTAGNLGFGWFFFYALISVFVHHLLFFIVEVMSMSHFRYLGLKILFSTLVSLVIIIAIQLLFYPARRRRLV